MSLLSLFKKEPDHEIQNTERDDAENHEEVEEKYYPSIPIRDIKDHLVKEFDNTKHLEQVIERKQDVIESLKITEAKYKATLVTLDEYSDRLDRKQASIEKLEGRLSLKDKENSSLNEKVNDLRIQEYSKEQYKKEIQKETTQAMRHQLIDQINNHSGVLPKDLIKQWIGEVDHEL